MKRTNANGNDPGKGLGPGRDLKGAAVRMGLSPHTVRVMVRRRILGHFRFGKRIVITDEQIDECMARHRVEARPA